ncbi:MAG: oxidoreductase [Bacteroidetes bacterium MedPE-SWsnd-G1]|nr:MAG: oxidoreductase [Bacteroidetes bacterium MedPE-SWsnd-G1]
MKKIKWGIIGCGNIANKFAADLSLFNNAELHAVASRSEDKAKQFASKHNARLAYNSYNALFNDSEIDIIYIATPHYSHAQLSIEAMEHGKHVLCEKPLGINKKEAQQMVDTSKRTNCFFMEALWTRFNPVFVEVLKRINDGEIGEVNYINADFAFLSNHALESRVFNLDLAGGALLDIGIYPVFLSYAILGIPESINASALFKKETGADIQTSMLFNYKKASAILYCGFTSHSDMTVRISGTEGQIHIHDRWHQADRFSIIKDDYTELIELTKTGLGYFHEIEECHKCLNDHKIESDLWSHQNSLDLISQLDSVREKIGLTYPMED